MQMSEGPLRLWNVARELNVVLIAVVIFCVGGRMCFRFFYMTHILKSNNTQGVYR